MSFREPCTRCTDGVFRWYSHGQIASGTCFACEGRGYHVFKTSPEARAKARAKAQAKREARQAVERAEREARAVEAANRGHFTLYLYTLARATQEAVKPAPQPVPSGRVQVTGRIISTREEWNAYGPQVKALIEDDRGFRVWGGLPSSLWDVEKGSRVTFCAALSPSEEDEAFGFWKRPTKAELLDKQEAA